MKIVKKVLVVILVAIVAILGFKVCTSIKERSEIKKVVEGYYDAWGKGEYSVALTYCDVNSSRYEMAEMNINRFAQSEDESGVPNEILELMKESSKKMFEAADIKYFGVKINGNTAIAYVTMKGYDIIFGGEGCERDVSKAEATSNVKIGYREGLGKTKWDIGAWEATYKEADEIDVSNIKCSRPEEHEINLIKINGEWKVTD